MALSLSSATTLFHVFFLLVSSRSPYSSHSYSPVKFSSVFLFVLVSPSITNNALDLFSILSPRLFTPPPSPLPPAVENSPPLPYYSSFLSSFCSEFPKAFCFFFFPDFPRSRKDQFCLPRHKGDVRTLGYS